MSSSSPPGTEVERELELAVPTLLKVGLFELFTLEEWLGGDNPGRRFIGVKAKEYLASHTGGV